MAKAQYEWRGGRAFSDLKDHLAGLDHPVLLVEGTRKVPVADASRLVTTGRFLASELPGVVFRTGNAEGSDTLFARGVAEVDAARLEYVIPNPRMGKARLIEGGRVMALDGLSMASREELVEYTVQASPDSGSIVRYYLEHGARGRLAAKATYLVRDTLKVHGSKEHGLAPAAAGVFYVQDNDASKGGTGHTIRVCVGHRVPVFMQKDWLGWPAP
jgi:hypothetical protein